MQTLEADLRHVLCGDNKHAPEIGEVPTTLLLMQAFDYQLTEAQTEMIEVTRIAKLLSLDAESSFMLVAVVARWIRTLCLGVGLQFFLVDLRVRGLIRQDRGHPALHNRRPQSLKFFALAGRLQPQAEWS